MHRNLLIILIFFSPLCIAQVRTLPTEIITPGALKFGFRTDYAQGNYGTPDKFVDTFATFSAQYDWERVSLKISMPYVWSKSESEFIVDPEDGVICDLDCPIVKETDKVSGRGNLSLALSYSLPKGDDELDVVMTGKVRFGTADSDKGMGTGKTDYSLDFEFSREFGALTPLLGVGYRWRGKDKDSRLMDNPYAWAGMIYSVTDRTDAELFYAYRRPSSTTSIAGRDISLNMYHRWNKAFRLNASIGKGLSINNPDWFVGLGVSARY